MEWAAKLSGKQARYLLRVKDNCDRLIRLINDLLDLSQIESGKIALQLEPIKTIPCFQGGDRGHPANSRQKRHSN